MNFTRPTNPLKAWSILALLTVLATALLWLSGIPENLDRTFFDHRMVDWASKNRPPANGALVLIDEYSLKEAGAKQIAGRWPWKREVFAAMISALHEAGASKIVLDFIFKEPDEDTYQDDLLGGWAAACTNTILASHQGSVPVFWGESFSSSNRAFQIESRIGHVDYGSDPDGVIRSYTLSGSLASKASSHLTNEPRRFLLWYGGLEQLKAADVPVLPAFPFAMGGLKILDAVNEAAKAVDPASINHALRSVDTGRLVPPEIRTYLDRVKGKVVFLGANTAGAYDLKATPVGHQEPGVLAHYTAWANLATGARLELAPGPVRFLFATFLPLLVLAAGFYTPALRWQMTAAFAALSLSLGASWIAFSKGVYIPPATAGFGIAFALLGVVVRSLWEESERRREIQQWFGNYVSREVVDNLVRNPQAIQLGGEKKELTVYFSDLAGFTDMSEGMQPEELVEVINGYLTDLSPCILKRGGYLDKYIGDAIMGVFGSPTPLENHAAAACYAALDSLEALAAFNRRLNLGPDQSLYARIGINTGSMIVGNIGSEAKTNYTVLGDAVNLSSRLEGANKEFGTTILLGERTEEMIRGLFVTRPVSRLRVKGKKRPVQTHELLGLPQHMTAEMVQFARDFSSAYDSFLARDFETAASRFESIHTRFETDALTSLYLDKARDYLRVAPPPEWDGVIQLSRK